MNGIEFFRLLDTAGFQTAAGFLSIIWQTSIVLAAAMILTWTLRHRSAAARHAVWASAVLAVPLVPLFAWLATQAGTPRVEIPVIPVHVAVPAPEMPVDTPIVRTNTPKPPDAPVVVLNDPQVSREPLPADVGPASAQPAGVRLSFWAWLVLGYCAVAAGFLAYMGVGRVSIWRLVRGGRAPDGKRIAGAFDTAAASLGLRRAYRIVESPGLETPITAGFLRPVVIVPERLAESLTDAELHALALHELSHVKRRDPLVLTLVSLVRAVFFAHPLVWLGARRTAQLAEVACDDAVVSTSGEALGYARMLARIAESLSGRALGTELAAGFVVSKGSFLRRIETILSGRAERFRRLSRRAQAAVVCAGILSLAVAVVFPLVQADESSKNTIPVTGKVLYKGQPVADVEIWLVKSRFRGAISESELKTRTGREGMFSFKAERSEPDEMPSGGYIIAYHGTHAVGSATVSLDSISEPLAITLGDAHTVSGIVRDAGGKPIANAEVWVDRIMKRANPFEMSGSEMMFNLSLPPLTVRTDGNGVFIIGHIPDDVTVGVMARGDGYTQNYTWGIPPDADAVSLTLERGGSVEGTVVIEGTRKPAADVIVSASSSVQGGTRGGMHGSTTTDARGRFVIGNLAAGMYKVYAIPGTQYPDHAPAVRDSVTVTAGGVVRNIEVALGTGSIITGRVTDAATGAPLKKVTVDIKQGGSPTETDDNGVYRIRAVPGSVNIYVRAPRGYYSDPNWDNLVVKAGDTVTRDFKLTRGVDVRITVRTADGKPVSGAGISTSDYYSEMERSDPKGVAFLHGLRDGQQLQLTARQAELKLSGSASVKVKPGASVEIVASPYETADITGRMLDDAGKPVAGTEVWIMKMFNNPASGRAGMSTCGGFTDREGNFRITGLIVGEEHQVQTRDGQAKSAMFTVRKNLPPFVLTLPKAEGWLEGFVKDSNGAVVSGVRVIVNGGPSGLKETVSDAKGWYRLDRLVARSEEISVDAKEHGRFKFNFVVTGRKHDFVLPIGNRFLAGKVVDSSGKPVPNISLHIQVESYGDPITNAGTDANGAFRFDFLPDATVTVEASWNPNPGDRMGYRTQRFPNLATNRTDAVLVIDTVLVGKEASVSGKVVPPPIGAPYAASRSTGTSRLAVDGDLSDWTAVKAVPARITDPDPDVLQRSGYDASMGPGEFNAEFRCCADRDFVYFAVRVADDTLRFGDARFEFPFQDDGVEFQLFGDAKPVHSGQIHITAEHDGKVKIEGRDPITYEKYPYLWTALGVKAALKQRAGGYDVEVAVPWSVLGWSGWGKGRLMGVNVLVYDRDGPLTRPYGVQEYYIEWAANPDDKYGVIAFDDAPDENAMKGLFQTPDAARIRTILDKVKASKWDEALAGIAAAGNAPWCAPMRAIVMSKTQTKPEETVRAFMEIARTATSPSVVSWAVESAYYRAFNYGREGTSSEMEAIYAEMAGMRLPADMAFTIRLAQAKSAFANGRYDKAKTIAEGILRDSKAGTVGTEARIVRQTRELVEALAQVQSGNR